MNRKHTTIATTTPIDDATDRIKTEQYHEKLAYIKEEIEKRIKTDNSTFLSDIIASLNVIKDKKTNELTICIKTDESFNPKFMTQRYTTYREKLDKR